jgi:hypothetical protein
MDSLEVGPVPRVWKQSSIVLSQDAWYRVLLKDIDCRPSPGVTLDVSCSRMSVSP